jgi:hypothetical protein
MMEDEMFEFNEYDVESIGQDEIDRLIDTHNTDDIKIELMYAVLEDENGEYYIKDGVRIDLPAHMATEPTTAREIALDSDF